MAKRGAPFGNKNASRGQNIRDVFLDFAEKNPQELEKLRAKLLELCMDNDKRIALQAIVEYLKRTYGAPRQDVTFTGELVARRAEELSDDELATIAVNGSPGIAAEAESAPESTGVY